MLDDAYSLSASRSAWVKSRFGRHASRCVTHRLVEPSTSLLETGMSPTIWRISMRAIANACRVLGDVGDRPDDIDEPVDGVTHRIGGGFDPDFAAALGDTFVPRRPVLILAQALPRATAGSTVSRFGIAEDPRMLSRHLREVVIGDREDVRVRRDDRTGPVGPDLRR